MFRSFSPPSKTPSLKTVGETSFATVATTEQTIFVVSESTACTVDTPPCPHLPPMGTHIALHTPASTRDRGPRSPSTTIYTSHRETK